MYFFGIDIPLIEIIFIITIVNTIMFFIAYFMLKKVRSIEDEIVSMTNKVSNIEETELNVVKNLNTFKDSMIVKSQEKEMASEVISEKEINKADVKNEIKTGKEVSKVNLNENAEPKKEPKIVTIGDEDDDDDKNKQKESEALNENKNIKDKSDLKNQDKNKSDMQTKSEKKETIEIKEL